MFLYRAKTSDCVVTVLKNAFVDLQDGARCVAHLGSMCPRHPAMVIAEHRAGYWPWHNHR